MATDPTGPGFGYRDAARASTAAIIENFEPWLLISALIGLMGAAMAFVTYSDSPLPIPVDTGWFAAQVQQSQSPLGVGYWLMMPTTAVISTCLHMIWSRISILGSQQALDGGFASVARRTGWALIRMLGLLGWFLGLVLIIVIFATIFSVVFALFGPADEGLMRIVTMAAFALPTFFGAIVLYGLWMVCLHAESRDVHLSMYQAWRLMGIMRWKLGGTFVLFIILLYALNFGIAELTWRLLFSANPSVTGLSVMQFLSGFALGLAFLWLIGIAAHYANRLVPGLEGNIRAEVAVFD